MTNIVNYSFATDKIRAGLYKVYRLDFSNVAHVMVEKKSKGNWIYYPSWVEPRQVYSASTMAWAVEKARDLMFEYFDSREDLQESMFAKTKMEMDPDDEFYDSLIENPPQNVNPVRIGTRVVPSSITEQKRDNRFIIITTVVVIFICLASLSYTFFIRK